MAQMDTRERLMDVAEQLFSEKGVEAVSVRAINKAAGVGVGVMHYHFRNRDELVESIILRHMGVLQRERLEQYEALAEQDYPDLSAIVSALVGPLAGLAMSGEAGCRYVRFLARMFAERSPILERVAKQHFDQTNKLLMALLKRALPDLSEMVIGMRMQYASHVLLAALVDLEEDARPWQSGQLSEPQRVAALVDFIVGGFSAPHRIA